MKVLKIPVCGEPYAADIENTLEAMQEIVGGYIKVVTVSDKLRMIVNEEGKLGAFMLNVNATVLFNKTHTVEDMIFGDAFVACTDNTGEDFTDMTDESIESLIEEMRG